MKKSYICGLVIFLLAVIILPFAIEALYKTGELYPIIHTTYEPSDILGYIITVIGLIISFVALYFSLLQFTPRLIIKRLLVLIEMGETKDEVIHVSNSGVGSITISNIGLCSYRKKKGRRLMQTNLSGWPGGLPKRIESGDAFGFSLGNEALLKQKIITFANSLKANGFSDKTVTYYISLSTGQTIIHRSKSDEVFLP